MSRTVVSGDRTQTFNLAKSADETLLPMESLTENGATWGIFTNGDFTEAVADPYGGGSQGVLKIPVASTENDNAGYYIFSSAQDWSDFAGIGFYVYFPEAIAATGVRIDIRDADGGNDTVYQSYAKGLYSHGWVFFGFLFAEMTEVRTFNSANVKDIRIQCDTADPAGTDQYIYVTNLVKYHGTRTQVMFSLDDGNDSDYDQGFSMLSAAGFNGTSYVYPAKLGESAERGANWATGRLTDAQMDEMYAAGWDFANHTWAGTSLDGETQAFAETALTDCENWLNNFFPRAARHVAYPGGFQDDVVRAAMEATNMATGRYANETNISGIKVGSNLSSDLLSLHTVNHGFIGETEYPTLADFLAEIDNAIAKRQPIILYGHVIATVGTGTSNTSIVNFQAIVDHVKMRYDQGLVDVKTISEFYADVQADT